MPAERSGDESANPFPGLHRSAPGLLSLLARHPDECGLLREALAILLELSGARHGIITLHDESGAVTDRIDCGSDPGPAGDEQIPAQITLNGKTLGHLQLQMQGIHAAPGHGVPTRSLLHEFCDNLALALTHHRETTRRRREETELREVSRALSPSTGQSFFHELVRNLSRVLEVDYAFVGSIPAPELETVETVAVWARGRLVDNFSYALAGTPCELVVDRRMCFHGEGVQQAFPDDEMLVTMGAESYLGVPLANASGEPIGLLAVLHTAPLDRSAHVQSILQITAARATAELERLIAEGRQQQSERQLEFLAYYDPLTTLPNRRLLQKHLERAIFDARQNDCLLAVLFLDLDRFKIINDTIGHTAGDTLLKQAGERLAASVRPGDTVARISGDEFIVVLTGITGVDDVTSILQHVLERFTPPYEVHDHELFISPSIGIAMYPMDGEDPDLLVKHADTALYHAKDQGRNNFQFYTTEMNERAHRRLTLETSLRRALDRDEFLLEYQPQLDIDTERVTGIEALLRWHSRDHGPVAPADFIPLAEDTGLILEIGDWVLHQACDQTCRLHAAGHPGLLLSVNLSGRQLQARTLEKSIRRILKDTGFDPRLLDLELTESMLTRDSKQILETMNEIRRLGVSFSIDDFGTGYSALSYLRCFPLSTLKIDKSFIADVCGNPEDAAIVHAIIMMAHGLGMRVIAEGVESEQQYETLRQFGCDMIQGYHFSRPLAPGALERFLDHAAESARR